MNEPENKDEKDEIIDGSLFTQRVMCYGCKPPVDFEPVLDQMRRAHAYRRALCLIERERRAAVRTLLPEDRSTWGDALRALATEVTRLGTVANEKRKVARAASGLRWGTYQLVEAADQASRSKLGLADDPRWPAFDGSGFVSEQIIGGMTPAELASDTQVQFVPASWGRTEEFGTLRLRMRSEKRKPIFAEWPIWLHRPLPEGAKIQRVTVFRELGGARTAKVSSGRREHWQAQFVVVIPVASPTCGAGIVGVDLGWRRIGEELRVAAHADEKGAADELRLSAHQIGGYKRVETLRSLRDNKRGEALLLVRELRSQENPPAAEWFKEETAFAHAWRHPRRIPLLLRKWSEPENRFPGDEKIFAQLTEWLERDRHLWQWESDQRRHNGHAKDKHYEAYAARLAKKYDMLVLENFDLRDFATRPGKDAHRDSEGRKESRQEEKARAWRHLAGTYKLRLALENAFLNRGGSICRVPAENTTKTCSKCGLVVRRDFAESITWTCDCGAVHDQDVNAGKNLCERFRALEKMGNARIVKAGKNKEDMVSRFTKGKQKRAAKEALAKHPASP